MEPSSEPLVLFQDLFRQAVQQLPRDPNAMVLSTVDRAGNPSSRVVLLKDFDERGFVFYTNFTSRKGRELSETGRAALLFWWQPLEKQVRIEGPVERVTDEEADAYFATRARGSQIGAWASEQSAELASREALEQRALELEARYAGTTVPRPPHWGGFRLLPQAMEFWTNRTSRLHDRVLYRRTATGWTQTLLNP
ncbi:MAG: pyridoxamine 5'-phosphate oxidase [Myxococcota bacterium]|nr:pyridoxamine 5'-phosphate oxidase [Myxococcota bacterium]